MALGTHNIVGRIALVTVFVIALLLALFVTSGWVFYADDRVPSHSARIGTFTIDLPEGSGSGTAFLINECGILTNFHVVFGPWYVTVLRPPSHAFVGTFTLTEVTLADGTHPRARAIPVAWGDYLGADRQWRRPQEDWAYLYIEPCLGTRYGYFDLREADVYEPPVERGFTAIGYSAGRQMTDPHCAARPESESEARSDAEPTGDAKGWLHDCVALAGDSGGPIFHGGDLNVVALTSAYRAGASGHACLSAHPGSENGWLQGWGRDCANIAVPVTAQMREKIWSNGTAVGAQKMLRRLGYDAGPLGEIESPKFQAALRQAQRDLGGLEGALPMHHFWTLQWLRYQTTRLSQPNAGAGRAPDPAVVDPSPAPPKRSRRM
jgi:hypothetical protein